ncbi:ceramide glucosyltransferase [Malassezia sp. CBS 17886]|nr:ceramide glucosyltransferase [Malassezia sp. CBS 17886]
MSAWSAATSALALVALGWYATVWTVCILGWSVAYNLFGNAWPRSPLSSAGQEANAYGDEDVPGVSVLRPLAGIDCNMYANLCSSFEQQYPGDRFEVILSVMSGDDQALPIARQVVAQYPHVRSRVVIGAADAGVNPKINNLVRPFAMALYDIVWVVDSQVWLNPQALSHAVDALLMPTPRPAPELLRRRPHSPHVGLVHHVPLGVHPADTFASHVERAFLSTTHAKMYLAINALAVDSCVMGKSNMYRKSDLARVPDSFFASRGAEEAIGSRALGDAGGGQRGDARAAKGGVMDPAQGGPLGRPAASLDGDEGAQGAAAADVVATSARALARFGVYLAEDNMLALSLWRPPVSAAHRIAPGDVAHVAVGDIQTLGEYARRRMRWIRVRRHMVPAATYLEPFTESLVAGLCAWFGLYVWCLRPVFGALSGAATAALFLLFFAAHLAAWYALDTCVLSALRGGAPLPDVEQRRFFLAWCAREALALPIWVCAMAGGSKGGFWELWALTTVTWRGRQYRVLADARAANAV